MVSSTSMRRGFVKLKGRRPASKPLPKPTPPPARSDDELVGEAAKTSVSFMHAPVREIPKPWWTNWRIIALVSGFVLLIALGIYFLSKAIKLDSGYSDMKATSSNSPRRGSGFMPGKGNAGDEVWGSRSDYSAPTDESFRATYGWGKTTGSPSPASTEVTTGDGAKKMVLNKNATGSCTIGANRIEDLQDCLKRESVSPAK